MTDTHAHVVFGIDDGPPDIEASMKLIEAQLACGVNRIFCTSHYYPSEQSVDRFAEKRDRLITVMREKIDESYAGMIELVPAAEVYFTPDLFNYRDLDQLCIGESRYMLTELIYKPPNPLLSPFEKPHLHKLEQLIYKFDIVPVMAHIERYPYLNEKAIAGFRAIGCMIQVNAESIAGKSPVRSVFKMIEDGLVDIIGSDCHDVKHRRPCLDLAKEKIIERYGNSTWNTFEENAHKITDAD